MSVILSNNGCVPRLNDAAEVVIKYGMLVQPTIADAVRNCVCKYSKPHTLVGMPKWIVYRIWNAIKSIFGQSDWQKTQQLVYERILAFTASIPTDFQFEKARTLFEETMQKISFKIAGNLLSVCLLANNSWSQLNTEEAKKRLRDHSIPAQLQRMSSQYLHVLQKQKENLTRQQRSVS